MYEDFKDVILNSGAERTAPRVAFCRRQKTSVGKAKQSIFLLWVEHKLLGSCYLVKKILWPNLKKSIEHSLQAEERTEGVGDKGGRYFFLLPSLGSKKFLGVRTRPSVALRECGAGSPSVPCSSQDLVLSKNRVKSHPSQFSVSLEGHIQEYQEQNLISFIFGVKDVILSQLYPWKWNA